MVVDAWGFDSERQAKAHRLRALRFRLSIARTAALVALVVVLVFGGSASLRDAVQSLQWPSWTSTILFLVLLFLSFLAIDLPFAYVRGHGPGSYPAGGRDRHLGDRIHPRRGGDGPRPRTGPPEISGSDPWLPLRFVRFPSDPPRGELGLWVRVRARRDPLAGGHGRAAIPRGRLLNPRPALSATRTAGVSLQGGPRRPILPRPHGRSREFHRRHGETARSQPRCRGSAAMGEVAVL